ncbi:MAG: signal peptidase I [bacterium]|nr:signal peptidase I [bacterium]
MSKSTPRSKSKSSSREPEQPAVPYMATKSVRETIESIAIAIILAFLFRGFEAEAFVIPTGSMAATLMGRHVDLTCPECGYRYQGGASGENNDSRQPSVVVGATCPICRYTQTLNRTTQFNQGEGNDETFSGDRILVNKLAYDVGNPERFDVIVFKYPNNAKQNYIKRLAGLPRESLRIRHGDLYRLSDDDLSEEEAAKISEEVLNLNSLPTDRFEIVRKPAHKIDALLQKVDDTQHIAPALLAAGWPSRWQNWSASETAESEWEISEGHDEFTVDPQGEEPVWLRYHHLVPQNATLDHPGDWSRILEGEQIPDLDQREGQLISDFYAYNSILSLPDFRPGVYSPSAFFDASQFIGMRQSYPLHWVGDLAVEANVKTQGDSGELLLDLVEGGLHFRCAFDVATGKATLSIIGPNGDEPFENEAGEKKFHPTASTQVKGQGSYRLRMANVDNQLHVWVNGWLVSFDSATTFTREENVRPVYSEKDPLDLAPAGIGSVGLAMTVTRLQIFRDIYYIATSHRDGEYGLSDYVNERRYIQSQYQPPSGIDEIFRTPELWEAAELFSPEGRREVTFHLGEEQYFPLGDNSPFSQDGRLWGGHGPFVDRELLIGKALFIYWPHAWNAPIPYTPNLRRMGLIR